MTPKTTFALFRKHFGDLDLVEHDHPNMESFLAELRDLCRDETSGFTYTPQENIPVRIEEFHEICRQNPDKTIRFIPE